MNADDDRFHSETPRFSFVSVPAYRLYNACDSFSADSATTGAQLPNIISGQCAHPKTCVGRRPCRCLCRVAAIWPHKIKKEHVRFGRRLIVICLQVAEAALYCLLADNTAFQTGAHLLLTVFQSGGQFRHCTVLDGLCL